MCEWVSNSRAAHRRHLTYRHQMDLRYQRGADGKFKDELVQLSGQELQDRIASLRKGQKHDHRKVTESAELRVDQVTVGASMSTCMQPTDDIEYLGACGGSDPMFDTADDDAWNCFLDLMPPGSEHGGRELAQGPTVVSEPPSVSDLEEGLSSARRSV